MTFALVLIISVFSHDVRVTEQRLVLDHSMTLQDCLHALDVADVSSKTIHESVFVTHAIACTKES
jgi:hypothetical protein